MTFGNANPYEYLKNLKEACKDMGFGKVISTVGSSELKLAVDTDGELNFDAVARNYSAVYNLTDAPFAGVDFNSMALYFDTDTNEFIGYTLSAVYDDKVAAFQDMLSLVRTIYEDPLEYDLMFTYGNSNEFEEAMEDADFEDWWTPSADERDGASLEYIQNDELWLDDKERVVIPANLIYENAKSIETTVSYEDPELGDVEICLAPTNTGSWMLSIISIG